MHSDRAIVYMVDMLLFGIVGIVGVVMVDHCIQEDGRDEVASDDAVMGDILV